MARASAVAVALAIAAALAHPPDARANGRMPGATNLTLSKDDPAHVAVSATYGLVQTFDGGQTFEWICEQALTVSGEADLPAAITTGGRLVLVPPAGGVLVSSDRGCSWTPSPPPLAGTRTVDLATDPGDAARVVVLSSTVASIDDTGLVTYDNRIVETRDGAATWSELAVLPSDFSAETIEVAPSDPDRVYVSGTASSDPLLGVVLRSEDGGSSWARATLALPAGSGSVFVSAVHPADPDRLWARVPARGDVAGLFATSLFESTDRGASWRLVASTPRGMFGLAISPDGAWLAYGGPFDGLYAGPSDGSDFTKTNDVGVRCLRWNADGLYACGSQPGGAFTLGVSTDRGATFRSYYDAAKLCPRACDADAGLRETCGLAWTGLAPVLGATGHTCEASWGGTSNAAGSGGSSSGSDGGGGNGGSGASTTGGVQAGGASAAEPATSDGASASGCGCRVGRERPGPSGALATLVMGIALSRSRWRRRLRADVSRRIRGRSA